MIQVNSKQLMMIQKQYKSLTFTENQNKDKNDQFQNINDNTTMFFIIEEARETILDLSQETVKVLWFFYFNILSVKNYSI